MLQIDFLVRAVIEQVEAVDRLQGERHAMQVMQVALHLGVIGLRHAVEGGDFAEGRPARPRRPGRAAVPPTVNGAIFNLR